MQLIRYNYDTIVAESFIILILLKMLLALLGAILASKFLSVPQITVYVFTSGYLTSFLILFFLWIRSKYIPQITLSWDILLYTIGGIIFIWLYLTIGLLVFGFNNNYIRQLTNCQGIYRYINIFWFVIWTPITEEVIFRGYYIKLLSDKRPIYSLLITSILFVAFHLIFNNYAFNLTMLLNGASFFFFSMIVGAIYLRTGIISPILIHIFSNVYFLESITYRNLL